MNESQDNPANLANTLYTKLGEAFDLAEQMEKSAQSNQELRQARRMATRIHRLRGDAIELRNNLQDQEK
jgi:ribulose-5-phosphate 4-epimerase/fuculose-1-phosphate aldolase